VNQLLESCAVHLHQLVQAVDQRIGRHSGGQRAFVGRRLQPLLLLCAEPEDLAQHLGLLRRGRYLAQTQGRGPFLGLARCKTLATWVEMIFSVAARRFMT
jgi:hypothetical protein